MKYFLRFLSYIFFGFIIYSFVMVVVYKYVPVTVTPLKVVRLVENFDKVQFSFSSTWRPLEEINPSMVKAVMASEDNRFLEHHGFDFEQVKKAIKENKTRKKARGASTISQQTAKNVFCFPSSSWVRKGFEAWFTVLIEHIWGKHRIMEVYLNIMETGVNVYGAQGAAQTFYDKNAVDLNNYESAMIAAVLPNPRIRAISSPSSYMRRRASTIRYKMNNVGSVKELFE